MFLFLSCCWKRNKVGEGKGSMWRKIFPIEVLWLLTFEFQIYDPCMELFQLRQKLTKQWHFLPLAGIAAHHYNKGVLVYRPAFLQTAKMPSWGSACPCSPEVRPLPFQRFSTAGDELRYSGFFSLRGPDCNGRCGKNEIVSGKSLSLLFKK